MRCDLQIFSGCVCHLEQLHAQSPFLFPIVFSINSHSASSCLISPHFVTGAAGARRGAAIFLATECAGTVLIPRLITRIACHEQTKETSDRNLGKKRLAGYDEAIKQGPVCTHSGRLSLPLPRGDEHSLVFPGQSKT